jgi:hypothetical protein
MGPGMSLVDDKHWNNLAQLGEKMKRLSRLLNHAESSGDAQNAQRLAAEIDQIQEARDQIIRTIAELSVAA